MNEILDDAARRSARQASEDLAEVERLANSVRKSLAQASSSSAMVGPTSRDEVLRLAERGRLIEELAAKRSVLTSEDVIGLAGFVRPLVDEWLREIEQIS